MQSAENVFFMTISDILPSQLYICDGKYQYWQQRFERDGYAGYEPVPIKRIGHHVFFTDGHTRALLLWQHGQQEIAVYHDPEDLDWIMYLVDLQWCRKQSITVIADLETRIVREPEYNTHWRQRCAEKHTRLMAEPLADLRIQFEPSPARKQTICAEVLPALPKWFGNAEAIQAYIEQVKDLPCITATLYGKVVGFCALAIHHAINAEIHVLAIFEEFHGRGIGTRLMQFVETYCRQQALTYMTVKTLSARDPDPHYRKTRTFYESVGFRPFAEFPHYWDEDNPCLYMLKQL